MKEQESGLQIPPTEDKYPLRESVGITNPSYKKRLKWDNPSIISTSEDIALL